MPKRFRIAIVFIKSIEFFAVLASATAIAGGGLAALFFLFYANSAETFTKQVLYAAGCTLACLLGKKAGSYLTREDNAFHRAKDSLRAAGDRLRIAADVAAQQRMSRRHP